MDSEKTCGNCRWGLAYPKPRPEPRKPSDNWFISLIVGNGADLTAYEWWKFHAMRHTDMVGCTRYPEDVQKRKDSLCGEHEMEGG